MPARHARRSDRAAPARLAEPVTLAGRSRLLTVALIVLAAIVYVVVQLVRPVPVATDTASSATVTLPGTAPSFAWPAGGQAAIGVEGAGLLAVHGATAQTPLASVTKLMTAYLILHDHPLGATDQGPDIPVGTTAVAIYQRDLAAGESVVAVQAGEQLTELQALEALLIPSGDNIATLLATWDAGSATAFVAKMNAAATTLGLHDTHYVDTSGVQPGSASTAGTQVKLAMVDMRDATFANVVGMAQVTLPVAGLQYNVDSQLGKNGIVGVKTGWTPTAGGCFVFAAKTTISGKPATVVGAVLHQVATQTAPSALTNAFSAAQTLLASVRGVERADVVHAGAVLGHLDAPWATPVPLEATRGVSVTGVAGEQVRVEVELPSKVKTPIAAHTRFGTAVVTAGPRRVRVPLETARALPGVSLTWRLTNV